MGSSLESSLKNPVSFRRGLDTARGFFASGIAKALGLLVLAGGAYQGCTYLDRKESGVLSARKEYGDSWEGCSDEWDQYDHVCDPNFPACDLFADSGRDNELALAKTRFVQCLKDSGVSDAELPQVSCDTEVKIKGTSPGARPIYACKSHISVPDSQVALRKS